MPIRTLFRLAAPALIFAWGASCLYNLIAGESGYAALKSLNRNIAVEREALKALVAEREGLAIRADRLASSSLDGDLAEERIRAVLGYAREGEIIAPAHIIEEALAAQP